IVPMAEAQHADFFAAWIAKGHAGEMSYLARNADKRRHPQLLLSDESPPLRALIVLAVNSHQFDLPTALRDDPSRGIIASYAWGNDYHEIIRPLLYALDNLIRSHTGRTTLGKGLVDSGPVLERDWAQQAGIGFIGKNCCTIHPEDGSWLLLATLMVPETLIYDPPPQPLAPVFIPVDAIMAGLPGDQSYGSWVIQNADSQPSPRMGTCGRCTRCLTACPTNAFVGPYHLDPQRCISYWTIETSTPIPRELRTHFGNRIFGCDICQEVCPWNQRLPVLSPLLAGLQAQHKRIAPPLLEGFDPATPYWLEPAAFSARFRLSPIKRAKRAGMLRNVCVALGNWADLSTVQPLQRALDDSEALVRGHAAWALGQIWRKHRDVVAYESLQRARAREPIAWVIEEINVALAGESG
ncbi:MAG: DUF1730 domain-containing protein, partial [Chloroflexi bacterium]|nr:DUF1730 domain-containing protein [Chloroflexota bacterium]